MVGGRGSHSAASKARLRSPRDLKLEPSRQLPWLDGCLDTRNQMDRDAPEAADALRDQHTATRQALMVQRSVKVDPAREDVFVVTTSYSRRLRFSCAGVRSQRRDAVEDRHRQNTPFRRKAR